MSPSRGIKLTVFLFVLVLVVFGALTYLLPSLEEETLPLQSNGTGSINMTESQFTQWLNGSFGNISMIATQIQGSGMGMGNTTELDRQLQAMTDKYLAEIDNISVPPGTEHAQAEFKAALQDYGQVATLRMEGAGMGKMGQSMEYFLRASIHANNAMRELGISAT